MIPSNKIHEQFSTHNIIKIQCAPHSSCTWFTETICKSFLNMQCIRDAKCTQTIPIPETKIMIAKTGTLPHPPYSSDYRWRKITPNYKIYNILYIRDPFFLFVNMGKEKWRGNCGGFYEKFLTIDKHLMYAFAHPEKYSAIVFAENFYENRTKTFEQLNFTLSSRSLPYKHKNLEKYDKDIVCSLMPFHCALYYDFNPDELGRLGQISINKTFARQVHKFPTKN